MGTGGATGLGRTGTGGATGFRGTGGAFDRTPPARVPFGITTLEALTGIVEWRELIFTGEVA
jgi:hypothetical protein